MWKPLPISYWELFKILLSGKETLFNSSTSFRWLKIWNKLIFQPEFTYMLNRKYFFCQFVTCVVCSFCSIEYFPLSISASVAFHHYKLTQQHSKQTSELKCWTVFVDYSISTVETQIEGIGQSVVSCSLQWWKNKPLLYLNMYYI